MYTVLFRSQEGNDARIVGSIFDFVFAPDDYAALFSTLFDPVGCPALPCLLHRRSSSFVRFLPLVRFTDPHNMIT